MQHLIRTLTASIGRPFTHVTKARENETFTVVEADSKEEAERKASNHSSLLFVTLRHSLSNKVIEENVDWLNKRLMERSILSKRQRKKWYKKHYGKDSE